MPFDQFASLAVLLVSVDSFSVRFSDISAIIYRFLLICVKNHHFFLENLVSKTNGIIFASVFMVLVFKIAENGMS